LASRFCTSVSNVFSWHFLLLKYKIKKHKEKKNHRKEKIHREGRELTFKLLLGPLTFGSRFYPIVFAFPFIVFSLGIFFFSIKRK
jgi:hypothetical protein